MGHGIRNVEQVKQYAVSIGERNAAFQKRLDAVTSFIDEHLIDGPKLLQLNADKLKELNFDLWRGIRHKQFMASIHAACERADADASAVAEALKVKRKEEYGQSTSGSPYATTGY